MLFSGGAAEDYAPICFESEGETMGTILLVVLLVLLFGGGGGYYWQSRRR
ncbi:MAG TPA: hypothetical protein VI942_09770 [Thermoanaerobaculia bacterium]|nr:hypothetical protein [Thermoanaerobaculia bacterium]